MGKRKGSSRSAVKPDRWLAKAVSRDAAHPTLQHVHRAGAYHVAADGARLHLIRGAGEEACPDCPGFPVDQIEEMLKDASEAPTRGSVSVQHFQAVVANARALWANEERRGRLEVISLGFNGSLKAEADVAGNGMSVELTDGLAWPTAKGPSSVLWRKLGPDQSLHFNSRLLADALSGFSEAVDFGVFRVGGKPALALQDGKRLAVVMSIKLPEGGER